MMKWKTNMMLVHKQCVLETGPINIKISHLFYVDDLKWYGTNNNQHNGLLNKVKMVFDKNMIQLGLDRCAKVTIESGEKYL